MKLSTDQTINKNLFLWCATWVGLSFLSLPLGIMMVSAFTHDPSRASLDHFLAFFSGNILESYLGFFSYLDALPNKFMLLSIWFLVVAALLFAAFLYIKFTHPAPVAKDSLLGNSRIISKPSEIKTRMDYWDGKGTPKGSGLVLGSTKDLLFYEEKSVHSLILGRSGSGKTQTTVIQSLGLAMAAGDNLVVTGKSELIELTSEKARELGYSVFCLDLAGYPSSRFNPIDIVVDYYESGKKEAAELASRQIASALVPIENESNPFFKEAARSLLHALILAVSFNEKLPREEKNLTSVLALLTEGTSASNSREPGKPLKDYLLSLDSNHPARKAASTFISDPGQTIASRNFITNLINEISFFGDSSIAKLTSTSDISIRDIVTTKSVVYIHLLEEGDDRLKIFSCFFSEYWKVVQEVANENGGQLPNKTQIFADEIFNLPRIPMLLDLIVLGRSLKIFIHCFAQNLNQLDKYDYPGNPGSGRSKILGSTGIKVALSLGDDDSCTYFSNLVGKRTIRQNSFTRQKVGFLTSTVGSSNSETADDLIHPWEWKSRVPIRDGAIVVKVGENARPGHEGVFNLNLEYASNTPIGKFFGLGSEDFERRKKMEVRRKLEEQALKRNFQPQIWNVRSVLFPKKKKHKPEVIEDEFSIWDD